MTQNGWRKWLNISTSWKQRKSREKTIRQRQHPALGVEALENRIVPAPLSSIVAPNNAAALAVTMTAQPGSSTASHLADVQTIPLGPQTEDTDPQPAEGDSAVNPTMINGAFLVGAALPANYTLPSGLTYLTPAEVAVRPFSFNDIQQEQSDTCAFASTLSAVARTEFPLESGITWNGATLPGGNKIFQVRLFNPDGSVHWEQVEFDGVVLSTDLNCVNPQDSWACLYQRAYLQLENGEDANYHSLENAFQALTGLSASDFSPRDPAAAQSIQNDLNSGVTVAAATQQDGPLVLDSSGLIVSHCYTVLGIEIPSSNSSSIYVTLRNPWAVDTDATTYLQDFGVDTSVYGLDGHNDGIIRIPWTTFTRDFTDYVVGYVAGPPSNDPLATKPPVFNKPGIATHTGANAYTVHEGQLFTLDVSATNPGGVYNPGYRLANNSIPGDGISSSGLYIWQPSIGQAGLYTITVVSSAGVNDESSISFQIKVVSSNPRIGSLDSDKLSVTTLNGLSDKLTLTAENVGTDFGTITSVEFFQQTSAGNYLLGYGVQNYGGNTQYPNNWTLPPGFLYQPQVGQTTVLAEAVSSTGATSPFVQTTVQVGAATPLASDVVTAGTQTEVNSSTAGQTGSWVGYDQSGDKSVVYYDVASKQGYLLRFAASGAEIGTATALNGVKGSLSGESIDAVAMLSTGQFVVLWTQAGLLLAEEFNADGTPSTEFGAPPTFTPSIRPLPLAARASPFPLRGSSRLSYRIASMRFTSGRIRPAARSWPTTAIRRGQPWHITSTPPRLARSRTTSAPSPA